VRVTLVCCVCVKGTHTTRWSKRERKVVHSFRPWCWCMMKSGERALPNTSSGLGGPTALFCRSCRRHCWGHQGFEVHMHAALQTGPSHLLRMWGPCLGVLHWSWWLIGLCVSHLSMTLIWWLICLYDTLTWRHLRVWVTLLYDTDLVADLFA
jgi:hypothetical protein